METSLKGIGKIKRAGGWIPFTSIEEATKYFDEEWEIIGYTFFPCRFCIELQRNRIGFKYSLKPRNEARSYVLSGDAPPVNQR